MTIFALLALPATLLGALISAAILLIDGRPLFYGGERLGYQRRRFTIYKFRTLVVGAEQKLGSRLESAEHALRTRTGPFLRETRLDELPQLFNVLRGDMSFVGPRPERPAVYEASCRSVPSYEMRFAVLPGLVGPSQLFTPHNAPKRLRAMIDNRSLVRASDGVGGRLWLIGVAVVAVAWQVGFHLQRAIGGGVGRLLRPRGRRRAALRRRVPQASAYVWGGRRAGGVALGGVVDVDARAFRLRPTATLPGGTPPSGAWVAELVVKVGDGTNGPKLRSARCRINACEVRVVRGEAQTVCWYEAVSPWSRYVMHQYLLRTSVAPLRWSR